MPRFTGLVGFSLANRSRLCVVVALLAARDPAIGPSSSARASVARSRWCRPGAENFCAAIPRDRCQARRQSRPCAAPWQRSPAARQSRERRRRERNSSPMRGNARAHSGTDTGPVACSVARESTVDESVAYAPPSVSRSISIASNFPSSSSAVRWRTREGWRLVVAAISSMRS